MHYPKTLRLCVVIKHSYLSDCLLQHSILIYVYQVWFEKTINCDNNLYLISYIHLLLRCNRYLIKLLKYTIPTYQKKTSYFRQKGLSIFLPWKWKKNLLTFSSVMSQNFSTSFIVQFHVSLSSHTWLTDQYFDRLESRPIVCAIWNKEKQKRCKKMFSKYFLLEKLLHI